MINCQLQGLANWPKTFVLKQSVQILNKSKSQVIQINNIVRAITPKLYITRVVLKRAL